MRKVFQSKSDGMLPNKSEAYDHCAILLAGKEMGET
jgi:hypothetical protein